MNLISKLLNRGKPSLTPEQKTAFIAESIRQDGFNQESEAAWKQLNAFRYEAIHDEDKEAIMAEKVLQRVIVPKVNSKTGEIEYERDEKKEIKRDGNGQPIFKCVEGRQINNFYAALLFMNSHVNRLSFIDPKKARLHALLAEDIIEDVKISSLESAFDSGEGAFLNSQFNEQLILLEDATNGAKVKTMFEIRKITSQDINFRQQDKKVGEKIF